MTYSQDANNLKTILKVGQEYGLIKDTVVRYLRIYQINVLFKAILDDGDIAFLSTVSFSYQKEN